MWRLGLSLPVLVAAGDVCPAGTACTEEAPADSFELDGDRPCREVLELLEAGVREPWARTEPALITGMVKNAKWNAKAFTTDRLQSNFGSSRVKVFSPAQASLLGGQTSRVHALHRVISKLDDPSQRLYVFDPSFFANASAKRIAQIPKWLAMSGGDQLLTMGGARSGAHFHAHGAAFLTLLGGRKRWHLHRPGQFPKKTVQALFQEVAVWEREVLPNLGSQAPISCVQHAGETVFVPDSWAHATSNIERTVGVAWQRFTTSLNTCKHGEDYMCLMQKFVTAEKKSPAQQPAEYRKLFMAAEELSGGFAPGFLRFLGPYWRSAPEGKDVFKRQLEYVKQMLRDAKPQTDEAVLAAALTKALVDALWTARPKKADKASALLLTAARKVPEAGLCLNLAQLYGTQGKWKEAVEQLETHLVHFPDDPTAPVMLGQARDFAAKR